MQKNSWMFYLKKDVTCLQQMNHNILIVSVV
jgi:hypothetical protein